MSGCRSSRVSFLVVVTMLLAACGSATTDLTTEDMLEKLAGDTLSPTEVADQLAMADLLCGFEGSVLEAIWARLDARQLEFQDFVFGLRCPDRLSVYASARPSTGMASRDSTTTTTIDTSLLDRVEPASVSGSPNTDAPDEDSTSTTGSG